ncbi:Bipolar DNA helicase HerA [Moritella sp. JT01]|uniref:ATP-binding protein n=1 Tax=Moritella sp. JT01 TaxID=756698 RepID=UPI0007977290|nr:ATP-binding protein [Moritella sp. JT01]KXO12719.1 Bipolar DNA helicase HerA [Moritella sp. JT01]
MSILVGEVIAISGVKVTLKVFEQSNKDTLFYDGEKYKGISIREYVSIQRGFRDIICIVEGEHLDEHRFIEEDERVYYVRKVELKPIGYYENDKFFEGIKFLPMIKDNAYLLKEDKLKEIYSQGNNDQSFIIGELLKEEIPISLPWQKLFNTHIGIFGNTGSGKSNTLTKLFTTLFETKIDKINGKSQFVLLDFNGEYTGEQLVSPEYKTVYKLNTKMQEDRFPLAESEFWNTETLSILFQATQNTQKPFINRIIAGRERFATNPGSFLSYIKTTYELIFSAAAPKPDTLDLIREITDTLGNDALKVKLKTVSWNTKNSNFQCIYNGNITYLNSNGVGYQTVFETDVEGIRLPVLTAFDEFQIRCNIQLIRDLVNGYVQFEHIQPLLKRIDSSLSSVKKVITVDNQQPEAKTLTVISLRKCNQEVKKVIPLLIAKHYYHQHKDTVENPPRNTVHLIIDEAHNVLSQQSTRENESWKDYRLELFEEIIKEGRKFGMYLTLSSQRPADISATIMSQIHNFFIHRLVNDRDLFLLDNTISTLDSMSRSLIPNLSKGSCIVTGTSFDLPMLLQVNLLEREKQPDSEDVNLVELWK